MAREHRYGFPPAVSAPARWSARHRRVGPVLAKPWRDYPRAAGGRMQRAKVTVFMGYEARGACS